MKRSYPIKTLLVAALMQSVLIVNAQPGLYSLAAVPDVVKTNAAVVTHSEKVNVEIESIDRLRYSVHKVFTVLNESGRHALVFSENISDYVSLTDVEIRVFDANGKQTGKYKKKDLKISGYDNDLITDDFVTYYNIIPLAYPVTVELDYELKMKGTFVVPDYHFSEYKTGVVSSEYTLKAPADLNIRYRPVLTDIKPVVTTEGNARVYRWAVNGIGPYEPEEGSSSAQQRPHVMVVSDQFSYDGNPGSFATWKSFGDWIYQLSVGRDKLTPEREEFFRTLVKDCSSDLEKVKKIYAYLQKNFRYVSIQLGIGGYRPLPASFTDKQKYGDCKGLSNYTKAALGAVGIPSCLTLINSASNAEAADPSFPVNMFNHMILYVPLAKDPVWLECTSSTIEFGHLGPDSENKNAVVLDENGGRLVATPKSSASSNYLATVNRVSIADDLSGISETNYSTKGAFSSIMASIDESDRDRQKQILVSYLGYKQPDDFEIKKTGKHETLLRMAVSKIPEFTSGDKLFFNQRIQKIWSAKLPKAENRKLDYFFEYPFEKYDTTIYQLPAGATVEVLLKAKKLESPYSSYSTNCWVDNNTNSVYVASSLILREQRIPAADYPVVKKFFDEVISDHTQKIVVKKASEEKKAF